MTQRQLPKSLCCLLVILVGCQKPTTTTTISPRHIQGSGVVEARKLSLAFKTGGRLVTLNLGEGQELKAGQEIARLDTAELQTALAQADATLGEAQAQLDAFRQGTRPEEITQARASVAEAAALVAGSKQAVQDAETTLRKAPQLSTQADVTKAQVEVAKAAVAEAEQALTQVQEGTRPEQLSAAEANVREAQSTRELAEREQKRMQQLFGEGAISQQQLDTTRTQRETAAARQAQAEARLRDLQAGARPVELAQARLRLERARAELRALEATERHAHQDNQDRLAERTALHVAQASLAATLAKKETAQSALVRLLSGSRKEDIQAAQKRLEAARAQRERLLVQQRERILTIAQSATVLTKVAEPGEVVAAGAPLAVVADLSSVWVRVYVSEKDYGRLKLGQVGTVRADSFPGRSFQGKITEIASQPEFTPRNVQTPEERTKLVFGIKVTLANPDRALKPGMPADCIFEAP